MWKLYTFWVTSSLALLWDLHEWIRLHPCLLACEIGIWQLRRWWRVQQPRRRGRCELCETQEHGSRLTSIHVSKLLMQWKEDVSDMNPHSLVRCKFVAWCQALCIMTAKLSEAWRMVSVRDSRSCRSASVVVACHTLRSFFAVLVNVCIHETCIKSSELKQCCFTCPDLVRVFSRDAQHAFPSSFACALHVWPLAVDPGLLQCSGEMTAVPVLAFVWWKGNMLEKAIC